MKKLFLSIALLTLSQTIQAQAYDGKNDVKIFAGYQNVGGKNGVDIQINRGLSDLISYGVRYSILIKPNKEEPQDSFDKMTNAFDSMDFAAFLRFHFSETFNLSERVDPFVSAEVGLKSIAGNVGIKYNISEVIGFYAMYNHSFSSSLTGDHSISEGGYDEFNDTRNYFGKKSTIAAGVTFNIF